MRQSIATTSRGHSVIPAMTRRTSRRIKSLKRMTKGTNRATRSSKMPQKPSTSSSEVAKSSVPGGNRNYYSEKSCPSSRRYHDHSDGRRSPSRSHETINGQASQSPTNSLWSWTRWWQRSSSPEYSSMAEAVSNSSSQYVEKDGLRLNGHTHPKQVSLLRHCPRQRSASTWHGGPSSHLQHEGELPYRVHQIRSC
jgi:hypothetical protein